jgi:hypothetical protein
MRCQRTNASGRKQARAMSAAWYGLPLMNHCPMRSAPAKSFFTISASFLVRGSTALHRACPDYQGVARVPLAPKMLSYNNLRKRRPSCTISRKTARRCIKRRNTHHNRPVPESFLTDPEWLLSHPESFLSASCLRPGLQKPGKAGQFLMFLPAIKFFLPWGRIEKPLRRR